MIYRKMYMNQIIPFIDTPFVKILTGVRRCGKSTVMEMIKTEILKRGVSHEDIISYRFDSLENDSIDTAGKLYRKIKAHIVNKSKVYIFLDEVQEVQDWEKAVNSFITDFNADVYVTGSNSRMMSSEISTYLTGRYVSFRIYPLSFSEYLEFRKTYSSLDDTYKEFNRYMKTGGFPALQLQDYSQEQTYTVIRDIYNSTIFTDIVKRNQIRKIELLERIVKYIFANVGQTFSALSLSKYLKSQNRKIDTETVYSYISKLESAYILHRCSRFDIKGKEILKTQEKFYLADQAFRFSVLGYSEDAISGMLENIVYLELKRRGFDAHVGKLEDSEIDFVATKQNEKIYIQIAKQINGNQTEKREYGNLLSIADNYPKYVLRTDVFTEGNHEGIKTMHIVDFLLSENW